MTGFRMESISPVMEACNPLPSKAHIPTTLPINKAIPITFCARVIVRVESFLLLASPQFCIIGDVSLMLNKPKLNLVI